MGDLDLLLRLLGIADVTVTGLLIAIIVALGVYIWRVAWPERKALESAVDEATEKLHDTRLLQLRAELRLEYQDRELARCNKELDQCERRTDQWRNSRMA
jgi:hypothetical protein